MARQTLSESELILLGAAVGVISDPALRDQIARKLKSALKSHAPRGTASADWKNWFKLCRAESDDRPRARAAAGEDD